MGSIAAVMIAAIFALALLMVGMCAFPKVALAAGTGASAEVATDPFEGACAVDFPEGTFLIDVAMEGGSGRAEIASPAEYEVFDGRSVVKIVWSSPHYDYMIVNGKRYLPVNKSGNSAFVIPVTALDEPVEVVGDTTAMGEAHEIDYKLTYDSKSVTMQDGSPIPEEAYGTGTAAGSSGAADADGASAGPEGASSGSAAASGESASAASASAGSASSAASSSASSAAAESGSAASSQAPNQSWSLSVPWIIFIICAVLSAAIIGVTIGILRGYRDQ